MTQQNIEALLGRPLTTREVTNIDLYLEIAKQWLEPLLCTSICPSEESKLFEGRQDMSTVFTGIFTEVYSVKVNGKEASNFHAAQWDRKNGCWYNSIVFDCPLRGGEEIEVTAEWGLSEVPKDLQMIIARLFSRVSNTYSGSTSIKSKRVEDFSITFGDLSDDQEFIRQNRVTLSKYSICGISQNISPRVCNDYRI